MIRTILDFEQYPPTEPGDVLFSDEALGEIESFEEVVSGNTNPVDELTMQFAVIKRDSFYHLIGEKICSAVGEDSELSTGIFTKLTDDIKKKLGFAPRFAFQSLRQGYVNRLKFLGEQDV